MRTSRPALSAAVLAVVWTVWTALPALATEGEQEKVSIAESQHDVVGLVLLAIVGVMVLAAVVNGINQLRGRHEKADGKFRWR